MPVTLGGRLVLTVLLLATLVSAVTILIDLSIVLTAGDDALASSPLSLAAVSTTTAAVFAAIIGTLVGVHLARLARDPVERMVQRVKDAGGRVLDGQTHSEKVCSPDPLLPRELHDLAGVVDGVLERLAQRQAELREAVDSLREAEEALDTVVSWSLDSQLLLEDDTIVFANPAAAISLASSPEALRGASLADLSAIEVVDDDGQRMGIGDVIEQALEGPVTVHLDADGSGVRSYVVRATRPVGSDGRRVLLTGRQVTEELRSQRIRSQIIEIVSHDLRAPLAVVNGYLDVLRRSLSDEDRIRAVDAAKRDAERMSDLLEDLLSAAQAEQLLAPAELVPVALEDLAGEVVASLSTAHPSRDLRAEVAQPAQVLGDAKRLRQALVNLVTNALRYSPAESGITVAVSCEEGRARLAVVDHGPGVPEDERDLVFERYARLDNLEGPRSGLGLGLYIVQVIARNHGGSARVVETPGGGATFMIELPLAVTSAGTEAAIA